jgi:hypothetical protein
MDSVKIEGRVYKLYELRQVSATFKTQTVVIKVEDKYPQFISIEFTQDRADLLSKIKEGDLIVADVNLRGKQYFDKKTNEERFWNKIDGWKIAIQQLDDNIEDDLLAPGVDDMPF